MMKRLGCNMKKLIIGFSRARSPWAIGSTAIQVTEKRNFSHAFVKYEDPITGLTMISQASHGMVHDCYIDEFLKANIIVEEYEIDCSDQEWLDFYIFNRKHQGVKYSTAQFLALTVVKIFRIKLWFKNGDKEFICSEWAGRVCSILNKPMPENLDSMTPSNLREHLLDLGVRKI